MYRLKQSIAIILVLVLLTGILNYPSFAEKKDVYYIRNSYTSDAFLYEADGVLRYGIPLVGDESFQWAIEERDGAKIIRNLATGNCISLKGHSDATVEGYWAEPVRCIGYEDGNDTFLWEFDTGATTNILSASARYEGFGLHLENVANGQPRAQVLSGDQLNWGNMKWDFLSGEKINFASLIRDGFCIQNAETGAYLKADNGNLLTGVPEGPDNSYIWIVENRENGTKAIKNKGTNEYIIFRDSGTNLTPGLSKGPETDESGLWYTQISKETLILAAYEKSGSYGLSAGTGEGRECIIAKADKAAPQPSVKWNFISASQVGDVAGPLILEDGIYNLKNSWFSMYMIEENGKPVYGNARPSDPIAQWRIIFDAETGLTAVKNEGTGHYLRVNSQGQLVCDSTESYYWRLNRNSNPLYPDAVQFQDSQNPTCFLHMEGLTGSIENSNAVQPSWGTPHWVPVKYDPGTHEETGGNNTVPEGYIRLRSRETGQYLYENSAKAVIYGDVKESDARSHWELIESDQKGYYLIKNREYGDYMVYQGGGMLRCVPEEDINIGNSLWEITFTQEPDTVLLNHANKDIPYYSRPYINIRRLSGAAQCSLYSVDEDTARWIIEAAGNNIVSQGSREEITVPLTAYRDTNLYRLIYNGEYLDGKYTLEYYGDKVRIINTASNKYLYYENGWKNKRLKGNNDVTVQWDLNTKLGITALKQGEITVHPEKVPSDSFYSSESAFVREDDIVFSVFAHKADSYKVKIQYDGPKTKAGISVNGIFAGEIRLPSGKEIDLYLNKGINTITISKNENIRGITIYDSINKEFRGASVPYIRYEAEDCASTGSLIEEDRTYKTISSESSRRMAMKLDRTGQYVKFSLAQPANALVIRYCIPDSPDGEGMDASLNLYINGRKSKAVEMTSRYSWSYGSYPWTNNPGDGNAHHFYDEVRIMLDETYPAGTDIKLQKDAANLADYYIIDFIEAEEVAGPGKRPENSLSITEFGAVPNDETDDTRAILECIKAAQKQGKEVWIPEGVFLMNEYTLDFDKGDNLNKNRGVVIAEDNLVIRGAGMWHSVLKGEYAAFFIKSSNIAFYDFSLIGSAASRRDSVDPSAIETDYNTPHMENITVQNVWIEHYKTGIWTHNLKGLHVTGCRIRNTYADGMNLRRGTSHSVVEHCDIRNTGDDALAQWSSDYSDTNNKIRFNTISLQWLANNIALYGGTDIEITDNLIMDTVVNGAGVNISTNFNPVPFEGTIEVARNTLIRCGSFDTNHNYSNGAIWFNTVPGNDNHANIVIKDNLILDSTYQGISFSNRGTVDNVLIEGNVIAGCGTYGIEIVSGASGSVVVKNNLVRNATISEIHNSSEKAFTMDVLTDTDLSPENPEVRNIAYLIIPVVIIVSVSLAFLVFIPGKRNRKANSRKSQ